jgi:putative endonuclease
LKYYTYIIKSESYNTFYYGSTNNPYRRLKEHNKGKVRYTKGRRPWKLQYFELFGTRSEAMKREKFFKTIEGYEYLKSKRII